MKTTASFDDLKVGDWISNHFVKGYGKREVVEKSDDKIVLLLYYDKEPAAQITIPKEYFPHCYNAKKPRWAKK
jgi:hypothetical protein